MTNTEKIIEEAKLLSEVEIREIIESLEYHCEWINAGIHAHNMHLNPPNRDENTRKYKK